MTSSERETVSMQVFQNGPPGGLKQALLEIISVICIGANKKVMRLHHPTE